MAAQQAPAAHVLPETPQSTVVDSSGSEIQWCPGSLVGPQYALGEPSGTRAVGPLDGWCVTDVTWAQLIGRSDTLDWLTEKGCSVMTLDAFDVDTARHMPNPAGAALIVMSCPCPPAEYKEYIDHLNSRYDVPTFRGFQRRILYTSVLMSTLTEHYSAATVVILQRSADRVYMAAGGPKLVPLKPIDGWAPKACNHTADDPFYVLYGGNDLVASVSVGGPLSPWVTNQLK